MTTGLGFRIENIWAYLAVHGDGDEGVAGFRTDVGWLPMIGADQKRIRMLYPTAVSLSQASGVPLILAQFGQRTDLERIGP